MTVDTTNIQPKVRCTCKRSIFKRNLKRHRRSVYHKQHYYVTCPDCSYKLFKFNFKNHRGNRTCSAIKHTKIMRRKGYKHIYCYIATLRRLGVKVISSSDAKTCVHIGNMVNTNVYGWTTPRAADVVASVRFISGYISGKDRNMLIKQGLTDSEFFNRLKIVNDGYKGNWWSRLCTKISPMLNVTIHKRIWDSESRRYHLIKYHPDGTTEPCCKLPNTDPTALAVAGAFGFPVPICVKELAK